MKKDQMKVSSNNEPTMPVAFVDVLEQYLNQQQLEAPQIRLDLQRYQERENLNIKELSGLLGQIQRHAPAPALGIRIGRVATPQHFGLVGYLLSSCCSLKQALLRYGRFQSLVLTDLGSVVEKREDVFRYQWKLQGSASDIAYEFSITVFINLYQALIGQKVAPSGVGLPIPFPADPMLYEALLGCKVEFNCKNLSVDIPSQLMLQNIATSDPYLLKIFDEQATALLAQQQLKEDSFSVFLEQLKKQIAVAMEEGDTRASVLSQKLGYSLRSFYRLLETHDHNYRAILADVRQAMAKRYLEDPSLSYSEISQLLGYSEQSAFIRAFKTWLGMTPKQYRLKNKH